MVLSRPLDDIEFEKCHDEASDLNNQSADGLPLLGSFSFRGCWICETNIWRVKQGIMSERHWLDSAESRFIVIPHDITWALSNLISPAIALFV